MKTIRFTDLSVMIVVIFAVCALLLPAVVNADDSPCYNLSGSWIVSNEPDNPIGGGVIGIVNWHPLDTSGNRWSVDVDAIVGDPKSWHPDAVSYTSEGGIAIRTGEKEFKGTSLGYIFNAEREILMILVVNLDGVFESCDRYFADTSLTVYTPNQDKNQDGIPDSDETPAMCLPWQFTGNRIPLMERCDPYQYIPALGDVWVTDDSRSTHNLIGGIDEDKESERCLMVCWYLDKQDIDTCHIYVSVDGNPFQYLCHTSTAMEDQMEWKTGSMPFLNPAFVGGPVFGHSYAFEVFVITKSGTPKYLGPFVTDGSVMFNQPPQKESEIETALKQFDQALNAQDMTAAASFLTDDFVFDFVPYTPPLVGKEAFINFMKMNQQTFTDSNLVRTSVHASPSENNVLVMESLFTGTHAATGLPVQLPSLQILDFTGSAMSKCTEYTDMAAIAIQTGVMPPPEFPPLAPSFALPDPVPTDLSTLESAKEIARHWSDRDLLQYISKVSPDGQFLTNLGAPLNREQLAGILEHFVNAAPDMENIPKRFVELNNGWAVAETVMKGTSMGPYFGMPPTGKTFEVRYVALYRFDENGLLVNFELYYDQITLFTQFGVIPRSGPVPASEAEMEATIINFVEGIYKKDVDQIANSFTDDTAYEFVPFQTTYNGHDGIKGFFGYLFESYQNFTGTVAFAVTSGNIIFSDGIVSYDFNGKNAINHAFHIWEFRGDKIYKVTEFLDRAITMRQWGLLPPLEMPPLVPSFTLPEPIPTGLSPLESAQKMFSHWKHQEMMESSMMLHPDSEFMTITGDPLNREELIGLFEYYIASAPDMNNNAIRFIDLGDGWVVAEASVQGTNTGPYFGVPPTGKSYDFRYIILYRFDQNGLLTNFELLFDNVTLLTQIGVIPEN